LIQIAKEIYDNADNTDLTIELSDETKQRLYDLQTSFYTGKLIKCTKKQAAKQILPSYLSIFEAKQDLT
jgi:hypothetical protein